MPPEETGAGVGTPTQETGAPGVTGGAPTTTTGQPTTTTPAGASTGGQPTAPRTVPLSELQAERVRRQQIERELQRLRSTPQAQPTHATTQPSDPAADEVRRSFYELFPHMRAFEKVKPEQLDGLLQMLEREPERAAQFQHYWSTFGRGALRMLGEKLTPIFGGQPESAARRFLDAAFLDWLENDPEAQNRFFEHDPTLAEDFVKRFDASILDPIRRSTLAKEQERAAKRMALPTSNPRTSAVPPNGQAKKKLEGEELHAAAAERFFSQR